MNFCHRTSLDLLDQTIKTKVLDLVQSNSGTATSQHDFSVREKYGPGSLIFYKLDKELENRILSKLPEKFQMHDPFVRVQVGSGAAAMPHIDGGRKSGIFITLTDDRTETKFYDWLPGANKNLLHKMIVDPEEIVEKMGVTFGQYECWLFNHAAIHSIMGINGTRITLNILFKDLDYDSLLYQYVNL